MYSLRLTNKIKTINNLVTQTVKSNLKRGANEIPKHINDQKAVILRKATELNSWYTRLLGLDEVRLYQERVVSLQEKLLAVQEKRRGIGQELSEIRKKSNELQDQIHKVKRQDDLQRFLDLMKEETEILKKELDVSNRFNECDREEREVFTAFTNAVRDSHEKQRAQLEYTKYFGLVLSLVGSFLTFCYSTLKKQDLKRFVEEHLMMAMGSSEPLLLQLQENQRQLSKVVSYIDDNPQVLSLINKHHSEIMSTLREPPAKLIEDHRKTDSILREVPSGSDGLFPDLEIFNHLSLVPSSQKVVLASCAALVGIVIFRAFISRIM